MTTNGEWLDYLAQNAPDELAAWFDAEHVETEERALDGDTEPENDDSRDKIEADVRNIVEAYNMDTQRHGTERFEHELYYSIIHLLERQAATTEEKTRYKWVTASAEEIAAWRSKAEKMKEQVYELTAERDKLKELNGYHAAQYELASEDCDRLQAQVNELQSRHCPHYDATEHTCDVHETRIAELTAERDELQAQADEKWNLYVAEHRRADSNAADREMYREATFALVDSITDGLRKVNSILDGKDEGLA